MSPETERELSIRYHHDTDTLVLRCGAPSGNGETVARNLVAYFNDDDELTGFVLEHAAELLLPHLPSKPQIPPKDEAKGDAGTTDG